MEPESDRLLNATRRIGVILRAAKKEPEDEISRKALEKKTIAEIGDHLASMIPPDMYRIFWHRPLRRLSSSLRQAG